VSLLVVGLSHRTATVDLLERASIAVTQIPAVLTDLMGSPHVAEAMVLSTCNRVELYAEVDKFHGGVNDLSDSLAARTGIDVATLGAHLYVHYADAAVQHLFAVAAGLDSMVLGETQIIGQLRTAYAAAQATGTAGRAMHDLTQQALRVGKRAHSATGSATGSVTGLAAAGASLVTAGLAEAERRCGRLAGRSTLVCGAGSMAALAVATLRRAGVDDIFIANRTPERARLLAAGAAGRSISLGDLEPVLSTVDIVVSCTGATGVVVPVEVVERAVKLREGRPLFVLDLALPRDVDPLAGAIDGVTVVDLDALSVALADTEVHSEVEAARMIVAEEVVNFLAAQRSGEVAPTVTALRSRATALVDAELARLAGRLPELDAVTRAEVESTVRRVVATLLHTPTVRVKELATAPGGDTYAQALRELFELDPAATEAVARVALPVPTVARSAAVCEDTR